jgi:hypothetical protein
VYGIISIIRKGLHVIENDPIHKEDGKTGNEPPGGLTGKVKSVEQQR